MGKGVRGEEGSGCGSGLQKHAQQAFHKEAEMFVAVVERWRDGSDRGWWGI